MGITTWNRLEPDIVHDDPLRGVDESLAARLADPLWMLARQWQMGELRGEDGGSLLSSRVTVSSYPVTELRVGDTARAVSADMPLEALVEPSATRLDLTLRVAGGELLAALLEQHGVGHLIDSARLRFAWPVDDSPAAELQRLVGARLGDGEKIAASVATNTLALDLGANSTDHNAVRVVETEWRTWYEARLHPAVPDAWIPDRLEHAFAVRAHAAEGWLELAAPEYPGGRLDWDSFAIASVAGAPGPARTLVATDAQPLVLDVPGMPVVRYWELEDPRFDAARVSLGPGDLATALLVEVALSFASDWFILPLVVPVGALHRVQELVVTDTFGVEHLIRPASHVRPATDWGLWRLSTELEQELSGDYLFIPSTVADTLGGERIEEVALHRDELANLVWAIERIVPDALGRGARIDRPPSAAAAPPDSRADLAYVPLPTLPIDRVPLASETASAGVQFRRATSIAPSMAIATPAGTLVTPDFTLREEEIGHDGVVIARCWQLALDAAGNRWLWCARSKQPGAAHVSVRIAFDDLVIPRRHG